MAPLIPLALAEFKPRPHEEPEVVAGDPVYIDRESVAVVKTGTWSTGSPCKGTSHVYVRGVYGYFFVVGTPVEVIERLRLTAEVFK